MLFKYDLSNAEINWYHMKNYTVIKNCESARTWYTAIMINFNITSHISGN
jgi:hypothetical protein